MAADLPNERLAGDHRPSPLTTRTHPHRTILHLGTTDTTLLYFSSCPQAHICSLPESQL